MPRGQTGQQLLLGAYSALNRQIKAKKVTSYHKKEMIDLLISDHMARGIVTRDLISGKIESHLAHAVILCTGGYGNVYYLSTNAMNCNVTAAYRCYKRGAGFCQSMFHSDSPDVHSCFRRLPVETNSYE